MSKRTNEAEIAAVIEIVLARAFHPRAAIVGNEQGGFDELP